MKTSSLRLLLAWSLCALPVATALGANVACSRAASADELATLADAPLSPPRAELLELAFDAASAFPTNPHAKNRSRAQETVIQACLELERFRTASLWSERVDDWRRGTCYAELAYRLAERGSTAAAEASLALARTVAERAEKAVSDEDTEQTWRRDRVLAGIARTELLLGRHGKAEELAAGLTDSEAGRVEIARAAGFDEEQFEAHLKSVDETVAVGNFDLMKAALESCVRLFDRFYGDAERRERVEAKIKSSWNKLPIDVRVDLMFALTESALDHQDHVRALALVEESKQIVDGARWLPEDRIPVLARLASLRFRAGDVATARSDASFALAFYDAEHTKIVDVYRAGALRPLAETYQTFGDRDEARKVYALALEAGATNPNSRPRAQDLVATCCSMAVSGFEPDPELRARARALRDALGEPW
ncbi:MAG: hypothetical protein HZA52_20725 [Planctomycetes bacterium]|nr:hypothetical protein [Planctomycetota bacterium]